MGCSKDRIALFPPLLLGSSFTACIVSCCCNWIARMYSSWSCCLLSATWAAITRCLSAIKLQSAQLQSLHLQNLLCPFKIETTPWFLQRAHLGRRGGVFIDPKPDDVATLILRITPTAKGHLTNGRQLNSGKTGKQRPICEQTNPIWKITSMFLSH